MPFRYACKSCSARVEQVEGNTYQCQNCGKLYTLLKAEDESPIDFLPAKNEPLGLPKGSVRALVTLALVITFVAQIHMFGMADHRLMQLLLTVIFYYFGFRKRDKNVIVGGRIIQAEVPEPLYLPQGFIRNMILVSIGASAFILRDRFDQLPHELSIFYFSFGALFAGYIFSKVMNQLEQNASLEMFNHIKAVIVLITAAYLVGHFGFGWNWIQVTIPFVIVSFYFGSRN